MGLAIKAETCAQSEGKKPIAALSQKSLNA
jgi:hypothetical protein